jgi:O-antigen/teichoic acid export membrane protein
VALGWRGETGRPHPWRWLTEHRSACSLYFGEFLTARALPPLTQTALAAVASMAALGAVRASLIFFGPLFTLQGGMYLVAVPDGARARSEPRRMLRLMVVVAVLSAAVAVAWTAVGLVLPDGIGHGLFGPTWDDAEPLMLPMGLMLIAATLFSGSLFGLRALGDARRSFRCRLFTAPTHVVFPLAGGAIDGARGFALGLALAEATAAVIWWRAYVQALREIEARPADGDTPDGEQDPQAADGALHRDGGQVVVV